ncbi:unnamed protein product [Leptosia nina]|uniref:MADF domain-containing protein n=1 Tax=Leptosia nina TaxID=320188 RepID=A0AAV1JIR9_9NEOP
MEAFIEGVRMQPCLWNPLNPDNRDMHIKDEAWQRVVEHYNNRSIPNIQVAKTEWKKLRDNHRDALKRAKLGKNKLLPAQITTWKYAKAMQFLEPHMKYRITENIQIEPSTTQSNKPSANLNDSDVSTTDNETTGTNSKRRCLENTVVLKLEHKKTQENDALESFFKCMLESTKVMPHWMQTQVKKKIFGIIIDAEEQLSMSPQEQKAGLDEAHSLPLGNVVKTEVHSDNSCDIDYNS